eukprot:5439933-Amphidinium_carterae.1
MVKNTSHHSLHCHMLIGVGDGNTRRRKLIEVQLSFRRSVNIVGGLTNLDPKSSSTIVGGQRQHPIQQRVVLIAMRAQSLAFLKSSQHDCAVRMMFLPKRSTLRQRVHKTQHTQVDKGALAKAKTSARVQTQQQGSRPVLQVGSACILGDTHVHALLCQ